MTNSLEQRFEQAVNMACEESTRLGYDPIIYKRMLEKHTCIGAAKILVKSPDMQSGFKKLKEMNRIDLTIEHIMTRPEFSSLFDKQYLEAAEFRLKNTVEF